VDEEAEDPVAAGVAVVDGSVAVLDCSPDDFSVEAFAPAPLFSDSRAFFRAADG